LGGFALLASASGDYANQIWSDGEEKNISEALRKTQKKSGTLRKKRTTKQKENLQTLFFSFALLCFDFKCFR
jgi:hypothetical protein